jgi:hypothetical protein
MRATTTATSHDLHDDLAALHDDIAQVVATTLEAGGPAWQVTAPLLRGLLGGSWADAPPVVLARALGSAQRCRAVRLERALARGDMAGAAALVAEAEHARRRLLTVLTA